MIMLWRLLERESGLIRNGFVRKLLFDNLARLQVHSITAIVLVGSLNLLGIKDI